MSLDLGTLTGYLDLDSKKFDTVIDSMPAKMKGSGVALGIVAGIVAAGVGAALTQGIAAGVDLGQAKAVISAQLGLTGAESARLGGVAGRLYADAYGETVADVSRSVQNVVSSIDGMRGATASTVEAMTAKFLNFNAAFEIDTARSTQVVGQLIKSGLVADANEGMDLLTAAMQRVPAAVREDVLDAADEYGPFFANLGIKGDEAFGLLVQAADKGMYGIDKTGDALKELSIRATDMSATSVAAYGAAGLNAADMSAKMLAGGDTAKGALDEIITGLLGIQDPVARSNAAIGLFGVPLEDLSVTEIPAFLTSLQDMGKGMENTGGAADTMGKTINDTAATSWTELSRTWDTIVGQIGGDVLPMLKNVTDFMKDNPELINAIAVGLGILAVAFLVAAAAAWVLSLTPVVLIIGAIVVGVGLLIAALYFLIANWDAVVAWLSDVWMGFVGWFTGVMDGFLGWWGGVWDGFLGFLSDAWDNIVSFVMDGLQGIVDLFMQYSPLGIIISNWDAIMAFFAGIPGAILEVFAGVGQWLLDVGHNILSGLATGIALGIMGVIYMFTQFPTDLLNLLVGVGTWLLQTGSDILAGLVAGLVAGWNGMVAFFTGIPDAIWAFMVGAAVWLMTTGTDILTGLLNGAVAGWNAVVAWVRAIPGALLAMLVAAASWLISTGQQILAGLTAGISAGWVAVVGFFTAIPGKVGAFLAAAGSWLVSSGSNMIGGLLNGVRSMWAGFMGFLAGIPGSVMGFFSGIGGWLVSAGKDLIGGLLNGIKSLAGTIGSFFLGLLPSWIIGPFKAAMGIKSPSKVFAGFGRNIGQGIMVGLDAEQGALDARVRALVTVPTAGRATGAAAASGGTAELEAVAGGRGTAGLHVEINGNVGWSPDEVAEKLAEIQRQAAALAGINDLVGVL